MVCSLDLHQLCSSIRRIRSKRGWAQRWRRKPPPAVSWAPPCGPVLRRGRCATQVAYAATRFISRSKAQHRHKATSHADSPRLLPRHAVRTIEVGPGLGSPIAVHRNATRGAVDHVVLAEQIGRVLVRVRHGRAPILRRLRQRDPGHLIPSDDNPADVRAIIRGAVVLVQILNFNTTSSFFHEKSMQNRRHFSDCSPGSRRHVGAAHPACQSRPIGSAYCQ